MRRFSLSMLLVAICLLPVGIGSGTSAHSHAVAALDGALANIASAQAQVLEGYFSGPLDRPVDRQQPGVPGLVRAAGRPGGRAAGRPRCGGAGRCSTRPARPWGIWRSCSLTASGRALLHLL